MSVVVVVGDPAEGASAVLASLSAARGARVIAAADAETARAVASADAFFVVVGAEPDGLQPVVVTDLDRLIADPRREALRLCEATALPFDQAVLGPLDALARSPADQQAFASTYTESFAQAVAATGGSLLVSTYQTGRLVTARVRDGALNTHFRTFDKPMGIAVAPGRIAVGTRTEVVDLRDMPAAAPKLDPPGTHDACFLPRNHHVTGDIAVHELAFGADDDLWVVATQFSCLATLDADHSFVPRWKPPFVSSLGVGDRCHLNGMALVDGLPRFVTALGTTDEPGRWRARKADGGVLLDVRTGEVVASGLSMPHSPRVHGGRIWVLESGKGTIATVDPATGRAETVAELPGFTRGLAFHGTTAFVGLSQIRESSTFGDLPITRRLTERQAGVWMVELTTGAVTGFLRFEDLVQEVFDVALLPEKRWPEIAEPASAVVASSFVLP